MHELITMDLQQIQYFLQRQKDGLSGYYNKNYKIEYNGTPYILRIPIAGAVSMDMRFISEEDVLGFLNKRSVSINIPRIVMNETFDGQKYFLHNFISGNTIEDVYPECEKIPDWIVKELANVMTKLHHIHPSDLCCFSVKMPWKIDTYNFYEYVYEYNKGLIEKYQKDYKEIYNIFGMPEDINDFIRNKKNEIENAPFVLAHSDIHRKNVIIKTNIQDIAIIDWELALVAPSFYDISIHLHKMRYTQEQENLFLDTICELSELDGSFVRRQVRLYRDIEEVKSVAIDVVRYLSIINDVSNEQTVSNAKRYFSKLVKAYACWQKDIGAINVNDVISFFVDDCKKIKTIGKT